MNQENIDKIFQDSRGQFDTEIPAIGHAQRFREKLESGHQMIKNDKPKGIIKTSYLTIAASLLLAFAVLSFFQNQSKDNDLASVSEELSQTQDFFTIAIISELNKVENLRNPENEIIISDALKQMELLETNYERLKVDLKASGNDKRVIYAMITNFQHRVDILEKALATIEKIGTQTDSDTTLNHIL